MSYGELFIYAMLAAIVAVPVIVAIKSYKEFDDDDFN